MKNEDNSLWGAKIERGRIIVSRSADEGRRCDVESIDRPGVIFYGLPSPALHDGGDMVYFFAFEDGKGAILGLIE